MRIHEKETLQTLSHTAKGPVSTVGFPPGLSEVQVGRGKDQPVIFALFSHPPG